MYKIIFDRVQTLAPLGHTAEQMAKDPIIEAAAVTSGINWGNLIAVIEKAIPVVLQLISLFGYGSDPASTTTSMLPPVTSTTEAPPAPSDAPTS